MTERAFPTEADRRQLIAIRAVALRRLVETLPMRNAEQKIRLVQELMDLAQNSDTIELPWATSVRTELRNQIVEHDPAIDADPQALPRILDLLDILEAQSWPPAWYAVASHDIDGADRSQILAVVDAYAEAARTGDEAAASGLFAIEGLRLEFARRWFRRHACDVPVRVERTGAPQIAARFDGRSAVLGTLEEPPLRLVATQPGGPDRITPVDMHVVRSAGGWRLG